MKNTFLILALFALAALLLTSCGYKAPPQPPEETPAKNQLEPLTPY